MSEGPPQERELWEQEVFPKLERFTPRPLTPLAEGVVRTWQTKHIPESLCAARIVLEEATGWADFFMKLPTLPDNFPTWQIEDWYPYTALAVHVAHHLRNKQHHLDSLSYDYNRLPVSSYEMVSTVRDTYKARLTSYAERLDRNDGEGLLLSDLVSLVVLEGARGGRGPLFYGQDKQDPVANNRLVQIGAKRFKVVYFEVLAVTRNLDPELRARYRERHSLPD